MIRYISCGIFFIELGDCMEILKSRSGKGGITFLIGLVLLICVVIAMLEMNGIINIRALFGGTGTFIVKNYEKEVKKLCSKKDEQGNYNLDLYKSKQEEVNNISDKEERILINKSVKILSGVYFCENNDCIYIEEGNTGLIHGYDCENNRYGKGTYDEYYSSVSSRELLLQGCERLDKRGSFEFSELGISCANYHCRVSKSGKVHSINCNDIKDDNLNMYERIFGISEKETEEEETKEESNE